MKGLLKALLLVAVAAAVLVFAFANRQTVSVSFDVLNGDAPAHVVVAPLFVVLFACLMVGIVVGGLASAAATSRHRRAARRYRVEAERLRAELAQAAAPGGGATAAVAFRIADRTAA